MKSIENNREMKREKGKRKVERMRKIGIQRKGIKEGEIEKENE